MGITYIIDEALGIARVRWDGAISSKEIRVFWPVWQEALKTHGFPPTLVDGLTCQVQCGTACQFQAFFGEIGAAGVFTDEAEALASRAAELGGGVGAVP
ncbi:MAG TPA: hypothetical protein VN436_15185 [Holophaga sp.]|nr:hypothetical protein [Holophaga sp.]